MSYDDDDDYDDDEIYLPQGCADRLYALGGDNCQLCSFPWSCLCLGVVGHAAHASAVDSGRGVQGRILDVVALSGRPPSDLRVDSGHVGRRRSGVALRYVRGAVKWRVRGRVLANHIPATVGRRNQSKLFEMLRDGDACLLKTIARQGTPCPPGTSLHRNVMKERAQIERVHGLVADFLTQAGNRSALAPEVRPRR